MGRREVMVDYVKRACDDKSVGYSQTNRWRNPDVDCSSLMYLAANAAGYNVSTGSGYTGTMKNDFTRAGFKCLPFSGNFNDAQPGDIYLHEEFHTEMYVGNGQLGGAHKDTDGKPGDSTGKEVSVGPVYSRSSSGWTWQYRLVPPDSDPIPTPGCPYPEPTAALKQGNSGDGVRWIQWHLIKIGANLILDGSFGPATNTAVRNFQNSKKLAVDGIVGSAT
ncbi:MAG: peptidoglycan-binding protein, partial [Betaproteobacteria bacterium]|nr:peptidoglycan-binding protein [Betaproteobacteria bacterium]